MRTLLAAVLTLLFAATASAALRDDLGAAKAAAIESAFAAALPGSTLEWDDTLTVKLPDGAQSAVHLVGPDLFGTIYVMHVELTDFAHAAVVHARTFSTEPAPTHPTDFLAAVPASGPPRIGRLDPTSLSIEVKRFDVVPEYEVPQTWPAVSVTYWAQYATRDWVGSVRWTGAYNMETMADSSRMPLGIAKRRATGEGVTEPIVPTRASEQIVEIEGGQTRQVVQYPCPMPCTFDGKSLLAAWGVTAPVVAAN
jgi:hypothetical protein